MAVERPARPWLVRGNEIVRRVLMSAAVLVLALGMVSYYHGVLIPMRQRRSHLANAPQGNWSDLYPAWLGARELLAHRRNPYSPEVTREIQIGFYGRPVEPGNNREEPTNLEAFAYPAYVGFLLAPSLPFSFDAVRPVFTVAMLLLTAASLPLWMRALNLPWRSGAVWLAWAAALSSYSVVDNLHLEQITLLVAALVGGAIAALTRGRLGLAGALLALTTVKPQVTILILGFLLLWALAEWRSRKWLAIGFGSLMAAMLIGSELLLPGWFRFWLQALHDYVGYHRPSLLVGVLGKPGAILVAVVAAFAAGALFWRFRKEPAGSSQFNFAIVTAITLTQLALPNAGRAYYNQVLLIPAAFWLFTPGWELARKGGLARLWWRIAVSVLACEWILALPASFAVLVLRRSFERETDPLVIGPQLMSYFFPLVLALFVLSVASQLLRQGKKAVA